MPPIKKISQRVFTCFAMIFLIAYLCIAFMAYTPWWYKASCDIHPRCEKLGMETAYLHIDELAAYFRHTGELTSTLWSDKERKHLLEVRKLYTALALTFLFTMVIFLGLLYKKPLNELYAASKVNLVIIIGLLLLTPWFTPFWREIHPYFFNNMNWLNTPREISFWITPRMFFQHSAVLIGAVLLLVHAGLLLYLRKRKNLLVK